MSTTTKDDKLYVSAEEVTQYLDDMANVLQQISVGILESKDVLILKCEEHDEQQTEGESDDGEQD